MAMSHEDVRILALMLPDVIEGAHKGNADFRVGGRIFATLWAEEERVVVKLPPGLQSGMVEDGPEAFQPIAGAWGARGWTNVELTEVDEEALRHVLLAAWRNVAPPRLAGRFDLS